jgi:hypothetical protein
MLAFAGVKDSMCGSTTEAMVAANTYGITTTPVM